MNEPRYILVKNSGRAYGGAAYHELAADGSNPRCGTRINGAQWDLVPAQRCGKRRPCARCQQLHEATP